MISYYLNPKELPAGKLTDCPFYHYGTNRNSILYISSEERRKRNAERGTYYLCVEPHMTSTYSIVIHEFGANQKYQLMVDGHD